MYRGYIKLWRKIEDDELWKKNRRFSQWEAFENLLLMANHKKGRISIGYREVEVRRGEVFTSQKQLAKKWRWGIGSVNRFLNYLKTLGKVEIKSETKYTLIFIVNYAKYQRKARKMESNLEKRWKSNGKQIETYKNNKTHT